MDLENSIAEVTVFLLWHSHSSDNDIGENAKLLGVYSAEAAALARVQAAKLLPGFRDWPDGFEICRYVVDHDEWREGFVTLVSDDRTYGHVAE